MARQVVARSRGAPRGAPPSQARKEPRSHEPLLLGSASVLAFLLAWEGLADFGLANKLLVRPPSEVLSAGWVLFSTGQIYPDLWVSAQEFGLGFGLAVAVAIPLGLLAGWYRPLYFLLEPFLAVLYATPRITLLPLLFLWLGVEMELKVALISMSAFFPLILNVIGGAQTLEREVLLVARSFGAKRLFLFRSIVIPGSVPFIVSGLRLAMARGIVGLVVAEMFSANAGIGYFMVKAGTLFRIADMFFAMLLVGAIGVGSNALFGRLERSFQHWRPSAGAGGQ